MGYVVKEEDLQTGEMTRRGPFVTEVIAKPRTVAAPHLAIPSGAYGGGYSATSAPRLEAPSGGYAGGYGQRVGSPHSASCGARFARGIRYHAGRGGRDGTV